MADNAKWYVAHTYSGYENAVKIAIEKAVVNRCMEDMVLQIEIPMETVTEITESGVAKEIQRKIFPGYVLIKMVMTDDTWHLIRNIRGVTGFVGEANKAIPLTEDEVAALGMEKREIVVLYHVGDTVRITEGPLSSFTGTVEEIDPERTRSGWWSPCSAEKLPSSWSSIRWRSCTEAQQYLRGRPEQYDSGASGRDARHLAKSGSGMGRPLPHLIEGGAYKWHRK